MQNNNEATDPAAESPRYRLVVLAMLVLVYTLNFIDRQIVGILAVPIKADLGLSDTQLGLMGGLAFALFYTLLGIPIAMLADRSNRTAIMTVALVFWSAMTAVCGLAQNFWQLFLARLGVGVGEAGGVAPAYSIVADYFPPHQRARALGVYSFGVPIGSSLGILFGGVIASLVDWRTAFIVVGVAGIVLAPIFKLVVREPVRGRFDAKGSAGKPVGCGERPRAARDTPPTAQTAQAACRRHRARVDAHLKALGLRLQGNPLLRERTLSSRGDIEAAIRILDGRADEIIRSTGSQVFLTTAISQNGSLDGLMVLLAQSRMLWQIAHVYYQRPSARDLAFLYGNVASTALIASQLEDVDLAEHVQPLLSGALGSAAGAVPGLHAVSELLVKASRRAPPRGPAGRSAARSPSTAPCRAGSP